MCPSTPTIDYSLYLVTDRSLMSTPTLPQAVEAALAGGVTMVQLREKHATSREFLSLALECRALCDAAGAPLIINDRMDIAIAGGAAGLHVGQDDIPAAIAREVLGPEAIIGVSASTLEEALAAERDGASYLGVGAIYPTQTKDGGDVTRVGVDELREICEAVSIPVVAIGGINANRVASLSNTGISGVSVVSAIMAASDVRAAAQGLAQAIRGVLAAH